MEYTPFRLGYHLLLTTGTKFGLPEKELSKNNTDYILKGRYIGSERGGMKPDLFLRGHPIDILTKFIEAHDFASENSVGTVTYNLYGSRILFPASDIKLDSKIRGEDFFNGAWHHRRFVKEGLEFCYESGVLTPEPFIISPKEIEVVKKFLSRNCPIEYSEKDSGYVPKPQTIEPTLISESLHSAKYKNRDTLLKTLVEANDLCKKGISDDQGVFHELFNFELETIRDKNIKPEHVIDYLF